MHFPDLKIKFIVCNDIYFLFCPPTAVVFQTKCVLNIHDSLLFA